MNPLFSRRCGSPKRTKLILKRKKTIGNRIKLKNVVMLHSLFSWNLKRYAFSRAVFFQLSNTTRLALGKLQLINIELHARNGIIVE